MLLLWNSPPEQPRCCAVFDLTDGSRETLLSAVSLGPLVHPGSHCLPPVHSLKTAPRRPTWTHTRPSRFRSCRFSHVTFGPLTFYPVPLHPKRGLVFFFFLLSASFLFLLLLLFHAEEVLFIGGSRRLSELRERRPADGADTPAVVLWKLMEMSRRRTSSSSSSSPSSPSFSSSSSSSSSS